MMQQPALQEKIEYRIQKKEYRRKGKKDSVQRIADRKRVSDRIQNAEALNIQYRTRNVQCQR